METTNRFIVRNGEKIELTWEDEEMLRQQSYARNAAGTIENHCNNASEVIKMMSFEKLAELGAQISDAVYSDNGDVEYYVLQNFKLNGKGIFDLDCELNFLDVWDDDEDDELDSIWDDEEDE